MTVLFQAFRAAILDGRVYHDIQDDAESMFRALAVVLAAAIGFGLGVRSVTPADPELGDWPQWMVAIGVQNIAMLLAISTMLMSWVAWSGIAYYFGTFILRGNASYRRLLRAIGFGFAPGVALLFMGVFPAMQSGIFNAVGLWLLISVSTAIKESQGFGWLKTALAALFGWFVAWLFLTVLILSSITAPAA